MRAQTTTKAIELGSLGMERSISAVPLVLRAAQQLLRALQELPVLEGGSDLLCGPCCGGPSRGAVNAVPAEEGPTPCAERRHPASLAAL